MSIKIDPAFRKSGETARARQAKRRIRRLVLLAGGGFATAAVVTLAILFWPERTDLPPGDLVADPALGTEVDGQVLDIDGEFAMVQTEASAEAAVTVRASAAAFIDLRRDPMILRFEQSGVSEASQLAGPIGLDAGRVGLPSPDRLTLLTDDLVLQETRLVTTIPSTREDLALFQAQRSQGIAALVEQPPAMPRAEAARGEVITVDGDEGSWGELIETGLEEEGAAATDEAVYVETVIENTTSVALTLRESQRVELFEDAIVVLQRERELGEVLTANGIDEAQAALIVAAVDRLLEVSGPLPAASVVALRKREEFGSKQMLQMSLYGPEGYLAGLAQTGAGRFAPAADPWIEDDLMSRTGDIRQEAVATGEVRLLDALYSAAIRNGLPTTLVGELIVMMSQLYDLDRFAAVGDEVTILYATEPVREDQGPGRVLFAGIDGPSGAMGCYITPREGGDGFECFDFNARVGAGQIGGGLIVPVSGTKTSDFGPRMHPILGQMRNHNGVDWAAPTGTPIYAAAAGLVSFSGVAGGYGNTVYIDHPGGLQTRYAHLHQFADLGRNGSQVRAGDKIGYVGTTGRSTGPHLHFELRVNGTPVDPLTYVGAGSTGGRPGSEAVEALVNQIIQVESAGRADARNPLSTATGLGQFIESTWLRMMRTYRPDLVASMGRQQLLALRTDPALSREMVRNLARENEAFLRARGHQITPGRLYLAHFLGPNGAHTSLSSPPQSTVLQVMGAQVVNANPFLSGKTNADMWAWSDRKMRGMGSAATVGAVTTTARAVPEEVKEFREMVDAVLEEV